MWTSRLPGSVDFVVRSREAPQKGANVARVQDLNLEGALEQAWGVILDEVYVDTRVPSVYSSYALYRVSDSYESGVDGYIVTWVEVRLPGFE